jgi:nitrate reductase NapE component
MDPISLIATASAAYNAIKKGIEFGRELTDMGSQLSTWASALSDIDFLEQKAKKGLPWYKTFSNSAQQEAIEIFAAKHKAQQMRDELRTYIGFTYGPSKWDELLRIEAQVRKQRQEQEYAKREMISWIMNVVLITLFSTTIAGLIGFLLWFILSHK